MFIPQAVSFNFQTVCPCGFLCLTVTLIPELHIFSSYIRAFLSYCRIMGGRMCSFEHEVISTMRMFQLVSCHRPVYIKNNSSPASQLQHKIHQEQITEKKLSTGFCTYQFDQLFITWGYLSYI